MLSPDTVFSFFIIIILHFFLQVGDSGIGSLEKRPDGKYRQTGVVNIVLYVGLGLISLGGTSYRVYPYGFPSS